MALLDLDVSLLRFSLHKKFSSIKMRHFSSGISADNVCWISLYCRLVLNNSNIRRPATLHRISNGLHSKDDEINLFATFPIRALNSYVVLNMEQLGVIFSYPLIPWSRDSNPHLISL